jgi:Right handed beta helix region
LETLYAKEQEMKTLGRINPSRINRVGKQLGLGLLSMLVLVLAACGGSPATAPGFSLEMPSSSLSINQGANGQVKISVKRTGSFTGDVSLNLTGAPTGVTPSFSANPVSGAETMLMLEVADTVAAGNHSLVLTASSGEMSKTATMALTVSVPPAKIDTAQVLSNDSSLQVRQGHGNIYIEISGKGLSGISIAKLGDLPGLAQTNNDISAVLRFNIPAGAILGAQTLTVTSEKGVATKANAVTITGITASPSGDDTNGKGTPDDPYKTLVKALAESADNDTVVLLDGTYNETWPVAVPANRTIKGSSKDGTKLQGPGGVNGLDFAGKASVSDFSMTGFNIALHTLTNTFSAERVSVKSSTAGLLLQGDTVGTVTDSQFDENNIGVYVIDTATLELSNSSVSNNTNIGLFLVNDAKATVSSSHFDSNTAYGVGTTNNAVLSMTDSTASQNNLGLIAVNDADVTLADSSFNQNTQYGIQTANNATLTVTGGSASENAGGLYLQNTGLTVIDGVTISGSTGMFGLGYAPSSGGLKVRHTTISGGAAWGLAVGGNPSTVDLGTAGDLGNNTFTGNVSFQLYDVRPALGVANGTVITALGTVLSGTEPTGGIKTGIAQQISGANNLWRIDKANQRIQFKP